MARDTEEECDPGLREAANRDARKLAEGGGRFTCPDCGTPNALSAEEKRRGYHCGRCTALAEF